MRRILTQIETTRRVPARERDDQELFDRIATDYARKDELRASRIARKHRLLQTFQFVGRPFCERILEIGCGAGYGAEYLAGNYAHYYGVDYSDRLIEYARTHHQLSNTHFDVANATELDCNEKYDLIVMIGVLHHITDINLTLVRLRNLLTPGGVVVVNEPQPCNRLIQMARRARKKLDADYSEDQIELTSGELANAFSSAGLVNIRSHPQGMISTPFAEVVMRPQILCAPASKLACWMDRLLEQYVAKSIIKLSWNVIVSGEQFGGPKC